MPKAFFLDNGIRNQLFGGYGAPRHRADREALMKNLVFTELYKKLNPLLDTIRFWRTKSKAEVDFVIEHQGRLLVCEVKAGDARGKVSRSGRSFLEAYRPERFLIVHSGTRESFEIEGTPIEFLHLTDLDGVVQKFQGGSSD